ncbi:hypothetical protein L3Y34_019030 [Caenorhabditis briggsae]|uniref:Uncharacterized protein n=1 Tax=Caenorhabditis briggsae TaxID=6238 RepID=A0AAE9DMB4_CAEBR|nr:hypothetical protein L3Y34_019030 [Caenorhabditis briggsae]
MIFLINGTYELWVAIPILNKSLYTSWKYPYVLTLDTSIFIITILLVMRAVSIIRTSKSFHINLRIILIFQLCQWVQILLARYFLFPYLVGYRFLGDHRKIYHHFWTDSLEETVPIPCVIEEWPLFFGGFLYTHHFASCIFFLFSVSAERAIASFYLSDYEKNTRPYISFIIIFVSMIFSSIYSLIFAFNFFTFLVTSFLIALVTIASVSLYVFVYYYNTRVKKVTCNKNGKYTLTRRFQTMENLKSLKMAKYVVTTHAIYVALCEICLLCVYYGVESRYWEIFIYIMDSVVFYSHSVIVLTVLFSVPTWKQAFLRPLFAFRRMQSNKVSLAEEEEERNVEEDAKKISTVYFEQLDKAWT